MVRRRLAARLDAARLGAPQRRDRLAGREVEQVDRPLLVARRARGRARPSGSPPRSASRRSRARPRRAPSCMWPPRVSVGSSQWTASGRFATAPYWSARRIRPGETTGRPSSEKPAAPASASSPISVSSRAGLALRDRGEEADRHLRVGLGLLGERAEHGGRVDDRVGVRHRQDRAVAARRGGRGAGGDRLLVLAAGRSAGARAGRRTRARARARPRRSPCARSCRAAPRSGRSCRRRRGRPAPGRSPRPGRARARPFTNRFSLPSFPWSIRPPPPRRPRRPGPGRA